MSTETIHPQVREMAPDFVLKSTNGRSIQSSDYRGRRDLVLIFAGEGADKNISNLLETLTSGKDELEYEEAQVLVILDGDLANAESWRARRAVPFPVLADTDGAVHKRYAANIVITDRYGEIYSAHRGTWPKAEEVMASLRHINAECPE